MSGLDSSGDEGDSLMSEVVIRAVFLVCAEFNLGLVFLEITERETGCSTQSLEESPLRWCLISTNQTNLFYDAETKVVHPEELMALTDPSNYSWMDPAYLGIVSSDI